MSFGLLGAAVRSVQLGGDDLDWLLPDVDADSFPFDDMWLTQGGSGAAGVPPPRLRCLDSSHPPSCAHCTPAPPSGSEDDFELVGEPGKKNGEKRLRKLVARTVEWNSTASRAALAAKLEALAASHDPDSDSDRLQRVAEVVRAKHSGALSKRDLILIA